MSKLFYPVEIIIKKLTYALNLSSSDVETYLKVWLYRYNIHNRTKQIYLHKRIHEADPNIQPIKPVESTLDKIFTDSNTDVIGIDEMDFAKYGKKNTGLIISDLARLFKELKNTSIYFKADGDYIKNNLLITDSQSEKLNKISKIKCQTVQQKREIDLEDYLSKHPELKENESKITKSELWEKLNKAEYKNFPPMSEHTIKDFFKQQNIFTNFKPGRPKK